MGRKGLELVESMAQRRHRQFLLESPEHTASGSRFTMGLEVALLCGQWQDADCRDDDGIVEYFLRWMNKRHDDTPYRNYLNNWQRAEKSPPGAGSLDPKVQAIFQQIDMLRQSFDEFRSELKASLVQLAAGVTATMGADSGRRVAHFEIVPVFDAQPGAPVQYHILLRTGFALTDYALSLLIDGELSFGRRLTVCPICGAFFLNRAGNGRPYATCRAEKCVLKHKNDTASRGGKKSRKRHGAVKILNGFGVSSARALRAVDDALTRNPDASKEQIVDTARKLLSRNGSPMKLPAKKPK